MVKNTMKKLISILILSAVLLLTACGAPETSHYEPQDYILETEWKDDFKILQLCDIHLANKDARFRHYDFIDLTIKDADPDMIVLTGDNFTFADKAVAIELFDWMNSHKIPWALVWGNHDEQCYFSIDWVTDYLNNLGYFCKFIDHQDDDVYGNSNYAINLMDGKDIKEQIILMDSNRYNYGEYWGYDYIKDDQIEWYEDIVKYTKEQNGGEVVPSIAFFHIPLPEFQTAWDEAAEGNREAKLETGTMGEPSSCPQVNTGMFDKMLELGSTKAVCVAHDHINNSRILYKGIYLSYGVNSDNRIYYDEDMMGGLLITIHNDNSLDFDPIYHTYEEVAKK